MPLSYSLEKNQTTLLTECASRLLSADPSRGTSGDVCARANTAIFACVRCREPIEVTVTGAAGQIAYSLLFSLGKGDVFGPDQPVSALPVTTYIHRHPSTVLATATSTTRATACLSAPPAPAPPLP
jgi:hypothetical protein